MGKKRPQIPEAQLRISKVFSAEQTAEIRFPDGSIKAGMPVPALTIAPKTNLIIIGGGGGPGVGLRNGLIFARISTSGKKPALVPIAELETRPFICQSVAVHPKYPLQIVAALDQNISFCEFETFEPDTDRPLPQCQELYRKLLDTSKKGEGSINVVTFNKSGSLLLCAGTDQHIRVYNYDFMEPPSKAKPLNPCLDLNAGSPDVESISVSESETYIAACCDKKYALIWNRKQPSASPQKLEHDALMCRSCAFVGEELLVLGLDRKSQRSYIMKFDVPNKKLLKVRSVGKYWGKTLSLSPCEKYFAASFRSTTKCAFVSIYRTSDLSSIDHSYDKELAMQIGWSDDSTSIVFSMPSTEQRVNVHQISFPQTWAQLCLKVLLVLFVILMIVALFPETCLSTLQWLESMSHAPGQKGEL